MSHDHHDNHSNEQKPVSFTVPFYLATATLVIIFLFLSLCDPKKHGHCEEGCSPECKEACAHGDHSKHPQAAGHEEHNADTKTEHVEAEAKDTAAVETTEPTVADTTHKTEAAHEAHH